MVSCGECYHRRRMNIGRKARAKLLTNQTFFQPFCQPPLTQKFPSFYPFSFRNFAHRESLFMQKFKIPRLNPSIPSLSFLCLQKPLHCYLFFNVCALKGLNHQFAIPFLSEKLYHFQISSIAFLEYPCRLSKTTKDKIASILKFVT